MYTLLKRVSSVFGLTSALIGVAFSAALIFGWSSTSRAAPLFYDMTLTGTGGNAAGIIGSGSFSINDTFLTNSGIEVFCPECTRELLSWEVNFGGDTFLIGDSITFPTFPQVRFVNGVVTELKYAAGTQNFNIAFQDLTFTYNNPSTATPDGFVVVSLADPQPTVIPLPAALPLYGTGLAVMGFLGWRRKRQALRD